MSYIILTSDFILRPDHEKQKVNKLTLLYIHFSSHELRKCYVTSKS